MKRYLLIIWFFFLLTRVCLANDTGKISSFQSKLEGGGSKKASGAYPMDFITILSRSEIGEFRALTLAQVLRLVTEMEVQNFGYFGQRQVFSLPEGWSKRVVLMLDGQPLGATDPFGVDLHALPVDNVERVEVIRGGTAELEGPDGVNKAVNVVTRRFAYEKPFSQVNMVWGDYGLRWTGVQFGRGLGSRFNFLLSGGLAKCDGYRQNAHYYARRISGKAVYHLGGLCDLILSGLRYEGESGAPGMVTQPTPEASREVLHSAITLKLRKIRNPRDKMILQLFINDLIHEYRDPHLGTASRFYGRIHGGRLGKTMPLLNDHNLTFGGGFKTQEILTKRYLFRHYRAFLQDTFELWGQLILRPTVYLERYSGYNSRLLPAVGASLRLSRSWRFFFWIKKGFRPPDLNDRYWPGQGPLRGNPELDPEKSLEGGLGVGYEGERLTGVVNLFGTDLKGPIILNYEDQDNGWSGWSPINLDSLRIWGCKLELGGTVFPWLKGMLNVTIWKDQGIPWRWPRCHTFGYLQYLGSFFNDEMKTGLRIEGEYVLRRLNDARSGWGSDKFLVVHALAFWRLLDFVLYYRINNLLNREYQWVRGYSMPGRTHRWGFTWEFWD